MESDGASVAGTSSDADTALSDFWRELQSRGNDANPVDVWLGANDISDKFVEYWRVWVPRLLAPVAGRTSADGAETHDENRVRDVLLDPIDAYICGGTHAVAEVFKVNTGQSLQ